MVAALGVVLAATRGRLMQGRFHSGSSSYASMLRGVGRPTGGLNAELLGVLGVQSLPAAELHGPGTDDAPNGLTREEPFKDVEANVPARGAHRDETAIDVVRQRQARAAAKRFELPPDI